MIFEIRKANISLVVTLYLDRIKNVKIRVKYLYTFYEFNSNLVNTYQNGIRDHPFAKPFFPPFFSQFSFKYYFQVTKFSNCFKHFLIQCRFDHPDLGNFLRDYILFIG